MTTITITVNIATGDKREGDAEYKVNGPEEMLPHIDLTVFEDVITELIKEALADYITNNEPELDPLTEQNLDNQILRRGG